LFLLFAHNVSNGEEGNPQRRAGKNENDRQQPIGSRRPWVVAKNENPENSRRGPNSSRAKNIEASKAGTLNSQT